MADELRLPIKVVVPARTDFRRPLKGGGPRKIFGNINSPQFRTRLAEQVINISDHYDYRSQADSKLPRVARVILKDDALAKTHRPVRLFSSDTCPIIGGQDFGQMLISVLPQGLHHLLNKIRQDNTAIGIADISTVERIEPYTSEDAIKISEQAQIKLKKGGTVDLKFRLFQHLRPDLDKLLLVAFNNLLKRLQIDSRQLNYGDAQSIFCLQGVSAELITHLAGFVGTQSVSDFPYYQAVRAQGIPIREAQISDFPGPNGSERYPIVGIVDSGTNPDDPLLQLWRAGREEMVPVEFRDHNHGSFVAGLIVNGKKLNQDDPRFPEAQARFLDVVAIPGRGDSIREDNLLAILEEVIPKYPNVKVWNLSLSKEGTFCKDDVFSDFGTALY